MNNLHLFELINAPAGTAAWRLLLATVVAEGLIYLLPLGMAWAWIRGNRGLRLDLLQALAVVLLALLLGQLVAALWPQPRPFMLHLGTQYLAHAADSGLPSEHVTVFWSLALALLASRRLAVWALPLLAAGLLVGFARVYLGVHFPFDVLAAAPVAAVAATAGWLGRRPLHRGVSRAVGFYDAVLARLRAGQL